MPRLKKESNYPVRYLDIQLEINRKIPYEKWGVDMYRNFLTQRRQKDD